MTAIRSFGATAGFAVVGVLILGSGAGRAQNFFDDRPSLQMREWGVRYVPRSTLTDFDGSWPMDRGRVLYRGRTRMIVPVGPDPEGGRAIAIGIGTTF